MGVDTIMIPTSIVIDEVLDENSISNICNSLDKTNGDPFFYSMEDEHLFNNFCLSMVNLASQYYDLTDAVGYEFWTRLNTCVEGWHRDKDERLFDEKKIISFPLCTIIYYPIVKDLKGGELLLMDDMVTPKTNRMVMLASGVPHNVNEFTGERVSMMVNPWSRKFISQTYDDNI